MRQRRRYYHPIAPGGANARLLNLTGFCRKHQRSYALNVMNNGRVEAGKCPQCYPPKPPAPSARSAS